MAGEQFANNVAAGSGRGCFVPRGKYVWSINRARLVIESKSAHVARTVRSAAASCTRDHLGHGSPPCISSSSSSSSAPLSSYTSTPSPPLPSIPAGQRHSLVARPLRQRVHYVVRNYGTLYSNHAHTADRADNLPAHKFLSPYKSRLWFIREIDMHARAEIATSSKGRIYEIGKVILFVRGIRCNI